MQIKVTYRPKKGGISIRVTAKGAVNVSAPLGTPPEEVRKFIDDNMAWIENALKKVAVKAQSSQSFFDRLPLTTKEECTDAVNQLDAIIAPMVARHEREMGVKCSGYVFKRMKSRWGSCNVRSSHISFNIYLLLLPEWCIEHVVVHELAHLIVPNHSAAFHAVMDRYFPRWREARAHVRRVTNMPDDME